MSYVTGTYVQLNKRGRDEFESWPIDDADKRYLRTATRLLVTDPGASCAIFGLATRIGTLWLEQCKNQGPFEVGDRVRIATLADLDRIREEVVEASLDEVYTVTATIGGTPHHEITLSELGMLCYKAARFKLVAPTHVQAKIATQSNAGTKIETVKVPACEQGRGIAALKFTIPVRTTVRHETRLWDPYGEIDNLCRDAE